MNIENQPALTHSVSYRFLDRLLNRPRRFTWINATPEKSLRIGLHNLRTRLACERARAKASGDVEKFHSLSSRGNGALRREIHEAERELTEMKQNQACTTIIPLES